ncbi:hypothetical protein NKG05_00750 [Oerskovia sp. M15]
MLAALVTVLASLSPAVTDRSTCSAGNVEVPCSSDPIGPDGSPVGDQFFFAHQPLGENGSITVRMTSMEGIITYPPPDHDEIVRDSCRGRRRRHHQDDLTQGSDYATLMMTGQHGVRMQHSFTEDVAGAAGTVSAGSPRWLRLERSGATITGSESTDGRRWTTVGTAHLEGLGETVLVGLFAASRAT